MQYFAIIFPVCGRTSWKYAVCLALHLCLNQLKYTNTAVVRLEGMAKNVGSGYRARARARVWLGYGYGMDRARARAKVRPIPSRSYPSMFTC